MLEVIFFVYKTKTTDFLDSRSFFEYNRADSMEGSDSLDDEDDFFSKNMQDTFEKEEGRIKMMTTRLPMKPLFIPLKALHMRSCTYLLL